MGCVYVCVPPLLISSNSLDQSLKFSWQDFLVWRAGLVKGHQDGFMPKAGLELVPYTKAWSSLVPYTKLVLLPCT